MGSRPSVVKCVFVEFLDTSRTSSYFGSISNKSIVEHRKFNFEDPTERPSLSDGLTDIMVLYPSRV